MICLKAIQTSFFPTQQAFSHQRRPANPKTRIFRFSKSRNESHPEGDIRKQELLTAILMLEAQKVRITNYVDEKAAYLIETTEKTATEMNEIREAAIRELNVSSSKMMEEMESKMQAYEISAQEYRREIQENDKKLADFETQIAMERNDGMFFMGLGRSSPVNKTKAMDDAQNIYLALMGLLVIMISGSFISVPSPD